jgi:hypothetical protein
MTLVILFAVLATGFAGNAFLADSTMMRIVMAALAGSFLGLAIGFGVVGPAIFLKDPAKGTLSLISWLVFLPLHLLNLGLLLLIARLGREKAYDIIFPGVFLGRRLGSSEARELVARGTQAVLDLTSEFPECPSFRRLPHYRCLPLLDTRAPTVEQLEAGVAFIAKHHQQGGVYVHCAMGHGRSATFVAAFLLRQGISPTLEEAENFIRQRRPRVGLNTKQREALIRWQATWSGL